MVHGTANLLGGTLDIVPGSSPPIGQEFAALTANGGLQCGSVSCIEDSHTFAASPGQLLGSNFKLASIRYTTQSIMVTLASAGLTGDYNGDGKVDAADYVVWRKTDDATAGYSDWRTNFGRSSVSIAGDYNGDDKLDAADYVVWRKAEGTQAGYNTWRSNFGRSGGAGSAKQMFRRASLSPPRHCCF